MFNTRNYKLGVVCLTCLLVVMFWQFHERGPAPALFEPAVTPIESEPLCPWRQPEEDLRRFFPGSTRSEVVTLILSGQRARLAERLGRTPSGDENALRLYRVFAGNTPVGEMMTRRVKGEYGGIELVLAAGPDGRVRGARIQRQREPDEIATAIERPDWLASFEGKGAEDRWKIGLDVPGVPAAARASASAIVEGARSLLVLLETAGQDGLLATSHH